MEKTRTKICPICGVEFFYKLGKGNDRKYCSSKCRVKYQRSRDSENKLHWGLCKVEGCDKVVSRKSKGLCNKHIVLENKKNAGKCLVQKCNEAATRSKGTLCEKHYYRLRRNGSFELNPIIGKYITDAGYVKILHRDHPLADSNGNVYEHRMIVYDSLNNNIPMCFWCGEELTWNNAVVDHLNENKSDNRLNNLVVSCNNCNRARGAMLPFLKRMKANSFHVFVNECKKHIKNNINEVCSNGSEKNTG